MWICKESIKHAASWGTVAMELLIGCVKPLRSSWKNEKRQPEDCDDEQYGTCDQAALMSCVFVCAASSWGKPQGKAFRDGFLHEALDEMSTPATKKSDTMQSSGKWGGKAHFCSQTISCIMSFIVIGTFFFLSSSLAWLLSPLGEAVISIFFLQYFRNGKESMISRPTLQSLKWHVLCSGR